MIFRSNIGNILKPQVHYDRFYIFVLVVVAFFAFFVNNSAIQPDIMECRNIVTAREMVHDGHWIRTTLNGEPRFEKPPLPTWLAAVAEIVAPDSIPAQRAMSGLAATMMVLFFYLLWRDYTHDRRLAFVSSLVLLTCYSVILMGRTATWDIYCHAFVMGGIYFMYRGLFAQQNSQSQGAYKLLYSNLLLAGLFFGLSFLSKGPTSYYGLLLPFVLALLIVNCKIKHSSSANAQSVSGGVIDIEPIGESAGKKKLCIWPAILLMVLVCVIIGGSWYFYLYLSDKQELLNVAGKETGAWTGYHTRPWWYYYKFTFETGIWGVLLICALFFTYWKHRAKDISVSGVQMDNADSNKFDYKAFSKKYLMPLLWMVISLVLLSAMPEKKKRYLLPLIIPASYLIGYIFTYWQTCANNGLWRVKDSVVGRSGEVLSSSKLSWRAGKLLFNVNTWIIAGAVALVPIACYILLYSKGTISGSLMAKIAIGIYIIFAFLVRCIRRQQPIRFLYFTVILMAFAEIAVLPYIGHIVGYQTNVTMTSLRTIPEMKNVPLYYSADTLAPRVEVIYDVHRPVRPLNLKDSSAVRAAAPCAVLTHRDFCKEGSVAAIHAVDTSRIGIFDNNRWLKTNRNYRSEFVYVVTLLK
jgi:4-amino-4-deoxy-L-arabinose transferase-like glycosyltransferase